ncbi:MAG: GtrA family protein [Pseudomonadota bacterium]
MDVRQYLRFVVSGAVAIGAYLLLFEAARLIPGLPLWLATGGSYMLATGLNYWLNYNWSFASNQSHKSALPRYAMIAIASVSLNAATVPFLVNRGLPPAVAGFVFAITWPIASYFLQKYWAFKSQHAQPGGEHDEQ